MLWKEGMKKLYKYNVKAVFHFYDDTKYWNIFFLYIYMAREELRRGSVLTVQMWIPKFRSPAPKQILGGHISHKQSEDSGDIEMRGPRHGGYLD